MEGLGGRGVWEIGRVVGDPVGTGVGLGGRPEWAPRGAGGGTSRMMRKLGVTMVKNGSMSVTPLPQPSSIQAAWLVVTPGDPAPC